MNLTQQLPHGLFVISLDFELYWGVRDKRSIAAYADNLAAVHDIVPRLLALFDRYQVHASWATVGLLFAEDQQRALEHSPTLKPSYADIKLSAYPELTQPMHENKYYFAHQLIKQIQQTAHQELASHTYAHYYCLEAGQTPEQFAADLTAAQSIATAHNTQLRSLVFPRNQYNDDYLTTAAAVGFNTFRGNESAYIHKPRNQEQLSLAIRGLRLLDSYINLSGHHCYSLPAKTDLPVNLASSCFYRAYSHRLRHFELLKHRRIKQGLKHAAKSHKIYHLWWHPHNFGNNIDRNFEQLEALLSYYHQLQDQYGLQSMNMGEVYDTYYRD